MVRGATLQLDSVDLSTCHAEMWETMRDNPFYLERWPSRRIGFAAGLRGAFGQVNDPVNEAE